MYFLVAKISVGHWVQSWLSNLPPREPVFGYDNYAANLH